MRKLAWFSFSFALAAALTVCVFRGLAALIIAGCFALVAVAAAVVRKWQWRRILAAALGLAVGFAWTLCYQTLFQRQLPSQEITGTVTFQVQQAAQKSEYGGSVYGRLFVEEHDYPAVLYLQSFTALKPGDTVTLEAAVRPVGAANDDAYYRSEGISCLAYARSELQVQHPESVPVRLWPAKFCAAFQDSIRAVFSEREAPFFLALLTGNRGELTYAQRNDFSIAGVAHIFAVSGLHVSMLLGLLLTIFGNRRRTAVVGIGLVWFFAIMVGASPSVLRAAVMQTLILLAFLVRREYDAPTALGAALLLILLPNPCAVTSLSLQLSFGAFAGILLFSDRLYRWMTGKLGCGRISRFLRGVARILAASISAVIFTTPLLAIHFSMVSLVGVLVNLLVGWAVTLAFQFGALAGLLGLIWVPVGTVVSFPARLLAWYILALCGFVADLPFSAAYLNSGYWVIWLVLVYGIGITLAASKEKKRIMIPFGCGATALFVCIWCIHLDAVDSDFSMTVLDVGQGECILLSSGGVDVMVDCGGSQADETGELAARTLLSRGDTGLELLVLTHYDRDHAGGVLQLLERVSVSQLYLPDVDEKSTLRREIETAAAAAGTELCYTVQDTTVRFGESVLQIFAPLTDESDSNAGLVALYSLGTYDVLIPGDLSMAGEQRLLSRYTLPDIEVLVAGHHGSKYSTGTLLLEKTKPETVVISVGKNSYGHPAEETLKRITASGAAVYRTDQSGNILIRRD